MQAVGPRIGWKEARRLARRRRAEGYIQVTVAMVVFVGSWLGAMLLLTRTQ